TFGRIGHETKTQGGSVLVALGRDFQSQQCVDHPALGEFELVPEGAVLWNGQIRDHRVQPACRAERILVFRWNQPVADLMFPAVRTLLVQTVLCGGREGSIKPAGFRFDRAEIDKIRKKPQGVVTLQTTDVFKKDEG